MSRFLKKIALIFIMVVFMNEVHGTSASPRSAGDGNSHSRDDHNLRGFNDLAGRSIRALQKQIAKRLANEEGYYAIAFKDLQTGDTLFINEHQMMHAASTMKVAVMLEVFRQAFAGQFSLDDSIFVKNEFKSLIAGQQFSIDGDQNNDDPVVAAIGKNGTIRSLIFHMITVSSNLATNLLMERVGAAQVQATVRRLGADHMQILRGVEDPFAYEKGLNNRTDAYDLLMLFEAIAKKKNIPPHACDEMIDILLQQKFRSKIPAQLPKNVRVANKTGSLSKIDHDAGIIFLPDGRQYILVILSQNVAQQKKSSIVISELSFLVYEWMKG